MAWLTGYDAPVDLDLPAFPRVGRRKVFRSMIPRRRRAQFRAVVRFSIFDPEWGGWRATNSGHFTSPEDYRDYLWSAGRVEPRLRMFGEVSLPIHQRMADRHDYQVLVQHSPDFPEAWLEQLRGLARTYPVLRLVPVAGWVEARDTVAEDMAASGRTGPVVMLRLDDDDVLSADFLDLLAPYVTPGHHGWCISLGKGLASRMEGAELVDFRALDFPFSSVGQAYLGHYRANAGLDLSPLLSHRHVHKSLPTVVDSRSVSFIQVRHATQDSHIGRDPEVARKDMMKRFNALPPVEDVAELRAKFPTLSGAFDRLEQRAVR